MPWLVFGLELLCGIPQIEAPHCVDGSDWCPTSLDQQARSVSDRCEAPPHTPHTPRPLQPVTCVQLSRFLTTVDIAFLPRLLPAERPGVRAQPAVQTPARNETDPQPHPGSSPRTWQSRRTHASYSRLRPVAEPVAPLLRNPGPLLPRPLDPVSHRALGTLGKQTASLQPSLAFLISIICCAIVSSKLQHVLGIRGDLKVVLVLETDTFALDN